MMATRVVNTRQRTAIMESKSVLPMNKIEVKFSDERSVKEIVENKKTFFERAPRSSDEYDEFMARIFIRAATMRITKAGGEYLTGNALDALVFFYAGRYALNANELMAYQKITRLLKTIYSQYEALYLIIYNEGLLCFIEDLLMRLKAKNYQAMEELRNEVYSFILWLKDVAEARRKGIEEIEHKPFMSTILPSSVILFIGKGVPPLNYACVGLSHLNQQIKLIFLAAFGPPCLSLIKVASIINFLARDSGIDIGLSSFYVIPNYPMKPEYAIRAVMESGFKEDEIPEYQAVEYNPAKIRQINRDGGRKLRSGQPLILHCSDIDSLGYPCLHYLSQVFLEFGPNLKFDIKIKRTDFFVKISPLAIEG